MQRNKVNIDYVLHPIRSPVFANTENEEKCNLCADSDLFLWDDIERVTVHFPPGADVALRYTAPTTGREGQFSIESTSCTKSSPMGRYKMSYSKLIA